MASASVAQVLEALSALYSSTDPHAKKEATRWLEAFQKQVRCRLNVHSRFDLAKKKRPDSLTKIA